MAPGVLDSGGEVLHCNLGRYIVQCLLLARYIVTVIIAADAANTDNERDQKTEDEAEAD